nr:MAG TPA: hypothetical protein [Caudoviricetes sp.]
MHRNSEKLRVLWVNNKRLRDRGAQKTLRFLTFFRLIYKNING